MLCMSFPKEDTASLLWLFSKSITSIQAWRNIRQIQTQGTPHQDQERKDEELSLTGKTKETWQLHGIQGPELDPGTEQQ